MIWRHANKAIYLIFLTHGSIRFVKRTKTDQAYLIPDTYPIMTLSTYHELNNFNYRSLSLFFVWISAILHGWYFSSTNPDNDLNQSIRWPNFGNQWMNRWLDDGIRNWIAINTNHNYTYSIRKKRSQIKKKTTNRAPDEAKQINKVYSNSISRNN